MREIVIMESFRVKGLVSSIQWNETMSASEVLAARDWYKVVKAAWLRAYGSEEDGEQPAWEYFERRS